MDAGTLSAILIGAASLVGWLVTQTSARNKAQRAELRGLRKRDLLAGQYMHRLEHALSVRDLPLPTKPDGLDPEEGEEW